MRPLTISRGCFNTQEGTAGGNAAVSVAAGQLGNPAGRPPGSKNKLGEQFIADLYEHWQSEGPEIIRRAAEQKPAEFLKVIAMILPKDIKVTLETMTDAELQRRIEHLTRSLGLKLVSEKTIDGELVHTEAAGRQEDTPEVE